MPRHTKSRQIFTITLAVHLKAMLNTRSIKILLVAVIVVQFQRNYVLGRRVILDGHRTVKNLKPHNGTPRPKKMEDIIDSPKFRDKKMFLRDDADLWTDALSEYDKLLRGVRENDLKESTTIEINPDNDLKLYEDNDVPYVPSPAPMPMPKARRIVKVTHSDKIVRVDASIVSLRQRKPGDSRFGEAEAPGCSQNQKGASQGQQKSSGSHAAVEKELAVSDRVLQKAQMTQSMMYGNCGQPNPTGTVCYGVPSGCVEIGHCRLIVSFGYDPKNSGYLTVNFAGETSHSGYIAFAFSQDRFTGHDLVVYCINAVHLSKPAVALYLAFTENEHAEIQKSWPYYQRNFCPRFGYQQGEMMACSFDLARNVRLDDGSNFDVFKTPQYLMLAFGHFVDKAPLENSKYGEIKNEHLVHFSQEAVVLEETFQDPKIIYPRSRALILLHAIFAVVSFIFLIPTSIFIAKYGREVSGYDDIFGYITLPHWLQSHIFLVALSIIFILTSLITILIELGFAWRSHRAMPMIHSIVGIFAYILAFICFISGFFFKLKQYSPEGLANEPPEDSGGNRHNGSKKKCLIWAHWALGNAAYLCAVICVGVVGSMPMAQAPCFVEYFTYIHFGLYLCAHLVMMLDTRHIAKTLNDDSFLNQRSIIGPMIQWTKQHVSKLNPRQEFHKMDLWKRRRRAVLFFLLVSLICGFTISVLMLLPVVLCR